jgi:glutathionylspermidine synthase
VLDTEQGQARKQALHKIDSIIQSCYDCSLKKCCPAFTAGRREEIAMIDQMANLNLSMLVELSRDHSDAPAQFEKLNQFLIRRRCTFSGEPMPTLLKPNFISPKQNRILQHTVEKISSALNKLIKLYLEDEKVRAIMRFSETEEDLFRIEPHYSFALVISRLDAFMNDYEIKFLEFNCDSPAGTAFSDVLEEGFREIMNSYPFLGQWKLEYINRQELLFQALRSCYKEFRYSHPHFPEKPTIAIVDWDDLPTADEFVLLQQFFESKGLKTIITSPQRFTLDGDSMMADGEKVDLIYRRVITRELIEKFDQVQDFVGGARNHLACMCNPFRSFIVGNKKILDLLTDQRFHHIYDRDELEVIHKTIPWTRVLADVKATYNGYLVDLHRFVIDNKDKLVVKAASSYGGKDVFLGRETDQQTWEAVVDKHIESEEWVVQEYVNIPQEIFPEIDEKVNLKLKKVNINPFAFNGKYGGTISRVSDKSIINVSAGGGIVPTMSVVRKKDLE